MTDARSDREYAHLRRSFTIGLIAALTVMVLIGVVIHFANEGHHRPEGAAERWLAAIGDLTRKGVKSDAVKRAREIGPVSVGLPLLPKEDTGGKAAFPDLEVGKAAITNKQARVPYRLHQFAESGQGPVKEGVVLLDQQLNDEWFVTALGARHPDELVPSEGGEPPSSAPPEVWIGGAIFGLVLTVIVSGLIRWASPKAVHAQPA